MRPGGLKEQTAVFQLTGQTFGKVDLPLAEKPGIEGAPNLSGATLIRDFLFTLKFDADGNWKIVKTHQMSDREKEKEDAGER